MANNDLTQVNSKGDSTTYRISSVIANPSKNITQRVFRTNANYSASTDPSNWRTLSTSKRTGKIKNEA
jgi:hypothetical protein